MKLHRSGRKWIVPMITITQSTIPGRYIVQENIGDQRKNKVCGMDRARALAGTWYRQHQKRGRSALNFRTISS